MRESLECPESRVLLLIFEVLINTLKCLDGVPILYTDIPKLVGVSQGVALKLEALVGHAAKLLELLDVAGGTHGLFNDGLLQGYLLRFQASSALPRNKSQTAIITLIDCIAFRITIVMLIKFASVAQMLHSAQRQRRHRR